MNNRTGNLTNYHSHSLYCDGRANMEDFIRFALSEGFTSYGFSSHAPLPFPTAWTMEWDCMDDYLTEFRRLEAKYAGNPSSAGISSRRPDNSLNASAHLEVESAMIATSYPISR